MLEELKKLENLQAIDSKIFKFEEELDVLPESNDVLEEKIVEKENKIVELKNEIAIQVGEKEKRDDIFRKGEEKLRTITGKQSAIRNKEEYNALLREIDNIKRFNRDLSDEISEINTEIERKTSELQAVEEESSREIESYKQQIDSNTKRMSELEVTINTLYSEREELAKNIRPMVYNKYQRILDKSPNGRAIAIAEHRVCLGCNMTLPPELFNNVLRADKTNRIEVCPNCQCILIPSDKPLAPKEPSNTRVAVAVADDED